MVAPGEVVEFKARYDAKDAKWKVLVEHSADCFVEEDSLLGKALAKATLRLEAV